MKASRLLIAIVGVFLVFSASPGSSFAAQERGGGEVVDIGNRPVLRDLVDNAVCSWKSGKSFRDSLSYFPAVLGSIRGMHVDLAARFWNSPLNLKVCFLEADLSSPIPQEEQDGISIYYGPNKRQVAIRINSEIYIDEKIFSQMDPRSQAYLLVHEVMHELVPYQNPARMTKLRSFVKYMADRENQNVSPEDMNFQVKMNDIQIRPTNLSRQRYSEAIFHALNGELEVGERGTYAAIAAEAVCDPSEPKTWERNAAYARYSALAKAIEQDQLTEVGVFLHQGINPGMACPPVEGAMEFERAKRLATPLAYALSIGRVAIAQEMLKHADLGPKTMEDLIYLNGPFGFTYPKSPYWLPHFSLIDQLRLLVSADRARVYRTGMELFNRRILDRLVSDYRKETLGTNPYMTCAQDWDFYRGVQQFVDFYEELRSLPDSKRVDWSSEDFQKISIQEPGCTP